jgi:DNA-directed RNA polymerase specialized sigma24 family protein
MSADQIVALDQALEKLEAVEPILSRIVEMRYFGGSTLEETAEALAISTATAKRHWIRARAFLFQRLQQDAGR